MVNKHPIVFIHEDIIDESSMDSDATVELTTNNSTQTSSPPPSASINNDFPLTASNHQVRTNIVKTRPIQERTRSQHLQNEIMAMIELENGDLSLRALHAPRETLRTYIKERVPIPVPRGEDNFLNSRFDNDATLLHGSVQLLRHDVTEMLLTYGADVNIMDNGKTIAHTAAELNDTLLLLILGRHKADFSVRNDEGETPLMVAIALCNREAIKLIWNFRPINILSANEETILHYAARHNNVSVARQACHPDLQINIHQQSQHELRTALHIAVQQSNVTITRVLLEHGALDQWEDRYGKKAHEYIKNNAIGMLFFRYNLPCGIEPTDVSPRSTSPTNIEENSEQLHHNEAPQESNAQQQGPFRTKTFARLPITAEETTTSPPAKRRNFVPSERGKFTASTVRKGQQKETPMVTEPRAGTSTTINNQTTVAWPEPTPAPPYTNIMEPQPGPSSRECDLHTPPTSDNLQTTQSTY
jgi:ankyrin repeat protein